MFKPNKRKIKQLKGLFDIWALSQTMMWPNHFVYEMHEDSTGEKEYKDHHFIIGLLKTDDPYRQYQYMQYDYMKDEWTFAIEYDVDTDNPFKAGWPGFLPRARKGISQQQFNFLVNYKDYMESAANFRMKNKLKDDAGLKSAGGSGWNVYLTFKDFKSLKRFFNDFANNRMDKYVQGPKHNEYVPVA